MRRPDRSPKPRRRQNAGICEPCPLYVTLRPEIPACRRVPKWAWGARLPSLHKLRVVLEARVQILFGAGEFGGTGILLPFTHPGNIPCCPPSPCLPGVEVIFRAHADLSVVSVSPGT